MEYRVVVDTAVELVWLGSLLFEIGFPSRHPSQLWCNNMGVVYLTLNPFFHVKMKHVEVDLHFVREMVQTTKGPS